MRKEWAQLRSPEGEGGGGGGGDGLLPPPPASTPLEDQVKQMQADIVRVREAVQNIPTPSPPPSPPSPATDQKAELEKAFWKDPLSMTAAIAQRAAFEATQAAGGMNLDTLTELAKQQVRGTDPIQQQLFDAYSSEIEEMVKQMPPQLHSNKNVWQNATHVVLGRHINDIRKMTSQTPPQQSGGPLPSSPRAATEPKKEALSADEKDWARRWGITDDEYRHGKELYEAQDSAWDKVITLDSDQARRRRNEQRRQPAA